MEKGLEEETFMANILKHNPFTKSAFGSPGFRRRPDRIVIYLIGALLVILLIASIYGFTHNVGQGTKTQPTGKPAVPATVSPAATISSNNPNGDMAPSATAVTFHTGAEARALVIEYYEGYVANVTNFSNDIAARDNYLMKYMDDKTVASVDAQNWSGHVPCCDGYMSQEVLYEPAAVSGGKATVNIMYDIHHSTTPQVVVDLNTLKIISVKCVPAPKY
jgi:hypothetical protein